MHRKFDDFETTERNGRTTVTAIPASGADEKVRFDGAIAEQGSEEDPTANWEEIISVLAERQLGDSMAIDDGRGVMEMEEAADGLVEADIEHSAVNEHAARAMLEYMVERDILRMENGQVVLLMSYEEMQREEKMSMLNNWAATLEACVERIDTAVERVKSNKETLERHFEDLSSSRELEEKYARKADELKQEMQGLLAGRMPSELSEEEKQRFQLKKKRFERYQAFEKSAGGNVAETNAPEKLGALVDDMESVKELLKDYSQEYRRLALGEQFVESGAQESLESLTNLVTELGDVSESQEEMEQMSNDKFAKEFLDIHESTTEEVQQIEDEQAVETTR